MKKLIIKISILCLAVLGFLIIIEALSCNDDTKEAMARLTNSEDYLEQGSGAASILPIIGSAGMEDGKRVLVLGDSIAGQMFSGLAEDYPDVRIACANAAINISGQYMLASVFLDSHPEATDIWLYAHPLTLTRGYDLELGYGYAVMPFAIDGSLGYLDDRTLDEMRSVYGRLSMNPDVASFIDASPLNRKLFLSYIRMHNEPYVQENDYEIASRCIIRLKELCESRGVTFHFYSSPSTEYYRDKIEETRSDYELSDMYALYPDYLDSIYYFPNEWSGDMTHFSTEYANREVYDRVMDEAYDEVFVSSGIGK
jgi:hypothetical protein